MIYERQLWCPDGHFWARINEAIFADGVRVRQKRELTACDGRVCLAHQLLNELQM